MRIAILSRGRQLHSIRRLLAEARKARVHCDVIDPLDCQLITDGRKSSLKLHGRDLPKYDVVLPRIGASITDYGIAVVKHFELTGTYVVNSSRSIADSRDKFRCLQILTQTGLQVPATVLTRNPRNLRSSVEAVQGMPVVLKVLKGTQGVGVMLMHTPISLGSVYETLRDMDQDVLIQRFVAEGAGRDYRAFVIGDRVVAAMLRTAPDGEFRSNIHRGGEGKLVKLPKSYERAAIRAAQILDLQVAGVDLMTSNSGPVILEVNSSPGFEGIEKATGLNVGGLIVRHMCSEAKKAAKKAARRARSHKLKRTAKKKSKKKPARRPVRKKSARARSSTRA